MSSCPCRSSNAYESCCALYLEKKQAPQTPEQLMRSRYTAYNLGNIEYIKSTMKGTALVGFNKLATQEWAKKVTWLGLEIVRVDMNSENSGFVEFIARFLENDQVKTMHELSEFYKEHGVWFYISGVNKAVPTKTTSPKIARNSPCPCGSNKKFKNCHAK